MSQANPPSLAEWRQAGARRTLLGHSVVAHAAGNGPALLCIHGFPTASFDFRHLWAELGARYSLLAIDMLGFGDSDKPPGHRYTIAEQADLQLAALGDLGVGDFHVLAHDYGVTVAQELIARQLEGSAAAGLKSVCFLNGGLFPETHRPLLVQTLLRTPFGPLLASALGRPAFEQSLRRVFGPQTQPSDEELKAFWELFSRNQGKRALPRLIRYIDERRAQRARWVGGLQQTRAPLALICGALDPISGRHMAEHARVQVPAMEVHLLENIGHYPQVEDPQGVLGAYLAFRARLQS